MRSLLPFLGLILWFFLIKGCLLDPSCEQCCSTEISSSTATAPLATIKDQTGPLLYKWGSCDPVTDEHFNQFRDSIMAGMNDDRALEILGYYCNDELSACQEEDLGLARANRIGTLFKDQIKPDKIRLRSRLRSENCDELRSILFKGVEVRYLVDNKSVKEVDDKALIYFDYGSDQKVENPQIDNYLKDVAAQVANSDQRIEISGHSDNSGSAGMNFRLGQKRADSIRDILIGHGVSPSKITTSSKGETDPIATNETEDGRQKNRRTELQIIK